MLVVGQFVAGELLEQEAVVRLVGVEDADDVVAIAPGVRPGQILLALALGVGVAGQVEPVPAPALAVARRGQQPVDQLLVGVGSLVARGRPGPRRARAAGRSGRTTPAAAGSSRSASGASVRPFCFELLEDEGVDRIANLPASRTSGPRPAAAAGTPRSRGPCRSPADRVSSSATSGSTSTSGARPRSSGRVHLDLGRLDRLDARLHEPVGAAASGRRGSS